MKKNILYFKNYLQNCRHSSKTELLNKQSRADSMNSEQDNSSDQRDEGVNLSIQRSCSEDSEDNTTASTNGFAPPTNVAKKASKGELITDRKHHSIESSDIGDSIEHTMSDESLSTRRVCSTSSASLASSSLIEPQPAKIRLTARSASEEMPSSLRNATLLQQQRYQQQQTKRSATSNSNGTLSGSSSQESLPSDQMIYHQYYHVFREGELEQLIDKYVENLHVISSYYDHASWCIVAEKVQVWTI